MTIRTTSGRAVSAGAAATLIAALCATLFVYLPGLHGPFLLDDFPNIIDNTAVHLESLSPQLLFEAAATGFSGLLGRPISYLSFALNYLATGPSAAGFKAVNLAIHLVNGLLIYGLAANLLRALGDRTLHSEPTPRVHLAAAVVAAIWLLHPLQLTSVLYVVQRMNSLATLFTLAGLVIYSGARIRHLASGAPLLKPILVTVAFGVLAALSKENGVLIFGYLLAIEATIFRFATVDSASRHTLTAFFALSVAVPILALGSWLLFQPDSLLSRYESRPFSLLERLMTEARVIWFYLALLVFPSLTKMGLYHDDFPVSTSLFAPPSTLIAILGLGLLIALAWRLRRRSPVFSFGVAWFLVGHSMESTFIPLELVFEHRNYLPVFGIVLTAVALGQQLLGKYSGRGIVAFAAAGFLMLFSAMTAVRAHDWAEPVRHALIEARHHPQSPRANYEAGRIYAIMMRQSESPHREIFFFKAREYFNRATTLSADHTPGLFALIRLHSDVDAEVPPDVTEELQRRLEYSHYQSASVNWLSTIVGCVIESKCRLDLEQTRALFEAALNNPAVPARAKADIWSKLSELEFKYGRDQNRAMTAALQALAASPDSLKSHYALNLANLQIALGNFAYASELLQTVEADDRYGLYQTRIRRERAQLRQLNQ